MSGCAGNGADDEDCVTVADARRVRGAGSGALPRPGQTPQRHPAATDPLPGCKVLCLYYGIQAGSHDA
jgi:hypothetical protein